MENKVIYKNLRKVRVVMGLTQKELANLTNISENNYRKKELGYKIENDRCNRRRFYKNDQDKITQVVKNWLFKEDEDALKQFNNNKTEIDNKRKQSKVVVPFKTYKDSNAKKYSKEDVYKIVNNVINMMNSKDEK